MDTFGTGIGHSLAALMEDWDEELTPVRKRSDISAIFDSGLDNTPPASLQSSAEFQPQNKFFDLEEEMNMVFQTSMTPPPKPPRIAKQRKSTPPLVPPRLGLIDQIAAGIDAGWSDTKSDNFGSEHVSEESFRLPNDILPPVRTNTESTVSSTIMSVSSATPRSTSNSSFSNFILPEPSDSSDFENKLMEVSDSYKTDNTSKSDSDSDKSNFSSKLEIKLKKISKESKILGAQIISQSRVSSSSSNSIYDNIVSPNAKTQILAPITTSNSFQRKYDVWLPQIPTKLAGCIEAQDSPRGPTPIQSHGFTKTAKNEFGQQINELETYEVDNFDRTKDLCQENQGHNRQKSTASSVFFQNLKNRSMSIGNLSMLKGKKDKKFRFGRKKGKKPGKSVKIDVVRELPAVCAILEPIGGVMEYITVV